MLGPNGICQASEMYFHVILGYVNIQGKPLLVHINLLLYKISKSGTIDDLEKIWSSYIEIKYD